VKFCVQTYDAEPMLILCTKLSINSESIPHRLSALSGYFSIQSML